MSKNKKKRKKYKTSLEQLKKFRFKNGKLLTAKDLNRIVFAINQLGRKL